MRSVLRVGIGALCAAAALSACEGGGSGRPARGADSALARDSARQAAEAAIGDCTAVPKAPDLERYARAVPDSGDAGGLFHGRAEWVAVVNRAGRVCAVVAPPTAPGGAWPGSRAISMAKAFTANAFSTDTLALSTARLYTLTQPGHSLWGVGQPAPFDPACLDPRHEPGICGGAIAFGGGVPLYRGGRIVGGLGVSGDTPCADHEIAKRLRAAFGLIPGKGNAADDIVYAGVDSASVFAHPLCPNTWRDGRHVGEEPKAGG
jgi:uncharacterized protein GlcG (DUF336 family)